MSRRSSDELLALSNVAVSGIRSKLPFGIPLEIGRPASAALCPANTLITELPRLLPDANDPRTLGVILLGFGISREAIDTAEMRGQRIDQRARECVHFPRTLHRRH